MEKCKYSKGCGNYKPNSQTCKDNSLAKGYCGIRKEEISKSKNKICSLSLKNLLLIN